MTQAATIVGTLFVVIAAVSVVYGALLCYFTKVRN